MDRLVGRTCIVTGAGRGIGQAISQAFAREGAFVYGLDRSPSETSETTPAGGKIVPVACDISDPAAVDAFFDRVRTEKDRIDVLVNNAALMTMRGRITDIPPDQWNREISVNLTGAFLVTRQAIPLLKRGASVITLASTYAHVGAPNLAVYSAMKGALLSLTRTLALDHASDGIRFNTISPGPIMTERLEQQYGNRETVVKAFGDRLPIGRLGEPQEVAEAAVYLACDQSSFMTGSDLRIDGGYCAR